METIATMRKGQTAFLIAGDAARNKYMVLPGGGTVTMEILLPDNWDELVAPMGYEPLSRFYLEEDGRSDSPDASPAGKEAAEDGAEPAYIAAPAGLTDGEYRLVASTEYLTGEGLLFRTDTGAASAWAHGAASARTLPDEEGFAGLVKALFSGCSLTVEGGRVAGVTLRPQTSGQRGGGDAMGLTAALPEDQWVKLAVVTRQSRQ